MALVAGATGRAGRPLFGESGGHWRGCDSAAIAHAAVVAGAHGVTTIVLLTGTLLTRASLVSQVAQFRPQIERFLVLRAALRDFLTDCTTTAQ